LPMESGKEEDEVNRIFVIGLGLPLAISVAESVSEAVEIRWLGHSCFLITSSKGIKLITDPYEPGGFGGAIGYGKITTPADIVTVSHEHADHNYVKGVPGKPEVIRGVVSKEVKGIKITGIGTFHDKVGGRERGKNTVFVLEVDGLRICHLGDLGHLLTDEQRKKIGHVDVLLIPVGGTYTIDASEASEVVSEISPKVVIPMHYKTKKVGLPIAGVEDFTKGKGNVKKIGKSNVKVEKDKLPKSTEIWVLEPEL